MTMNWNRNYRSELKLKEWDICNQMNWLVNFFNSGNEIENKIDLWLQIAACEMEWNSVNDKIISIRIQKQSINFIITHRYNDRYWRRDKWILWKITVNDGQNT